MGHEKIGGRAPSADDILTYCLQNFAGTVLVESWGERGIFYNPDGKLARGVYILTVKEKDGENDRSSRLNRHSVYRVNLGLRRSSFVRLFGPCPQRPAKGGVIDGDYDFAALDRILPHPVYGWMNWICVLNPAAKTFKRLKPLLREAYESAKEKYERRFRPNRATE